MLLRDHLQEHRIDRAGWLHTLEDNMRKIEEQEAVFMAVTKMLKQHIDLHEALFKKQKEKTMVVDSLFYEGAVEKFGELISQIIAEPAGSTGEVVCDGFEVIRVSRLPEFLKSLGITIKDED